MRKLDGLGCALGAEFVTGTSFCVGADPGGFGGGPFGTVMCIPGGGGSCGGRGTWSCRGLGGGGG